MKLTYVANILGCLLAAAQLNAQVGPRILKSIDESRRVVLQGSTHDLAKRAVDGGPVAADTALDHMILTLKRSPEQQEALDALLEELQDQSSPNYHQWLSAEEFGRRFGPAADDLQIVSAWLLSHGFRIDDVADGRMTIQFSGTAGHLRDAFHTELHHIVVNGERHLSNLTDPEIPEALAPVIEGLASLNDFEPRPMVVEAGPDFLMSGGTHRLSPTDYAAIYNIKPLYDAGITGAGSTIAVLGRVRINMANVANFRQALGLPKNDPIEVLAGPDPGPAKPLNSLNDDLDQGEATLDLSWSGAVAPKASVKYVFSGSSATTTGLFIAAQYAIENKNKDVNADVMSLSYGACENLYQTYAKAFYNLAQQAASAGIAFVVSTGDSGSAGCDSSGAKTATNGIAVNYMASTPYTIAVGGTQFNDASNPSKYWSTSGVALGYVPENVWNQSCAEGQTGCSNSNIVAGSGGVSTLYTKPAWQTGVAGIPSANHRYLPDVSLAASAGHDPYLLCLDANCQGTNPTYNAIGGTSAAAPSFAGILALVKQKVGKIGAANSVLYGLAAKQKYSSCAASNSTPATTCVFNDITAGNNAVPGEDAYGTSSQTYNAAAGFDLATGLGSVNAYNLVNQWSSTKYSPSTTTLSISPATIPAGGSATVSVTVKPVSGTGKPTGAVTLMASTGERIAELTLSSGVAVKTISDWPAGTYNVTAQYAGDGTYSPSNSSPVPVTAEGAQSLQPEITSLSPGEVSLGQPVTITVNGRNFQKGLAVYIYLNDTYYPMTASSVTATQVKFGVTMNGTDPYTAYVVIVNPGDLWTYAAFDVNY
jgi:subtilase family serine protease